MMIMRGARKTISSLKRGIMLDVFMMIMRGAREKISNLNRGIMLAVFYDDYAGS